MTLSLATYLASFAVPSERVQAIKNTTTVFANSAKESTWYTAPFAAPNPGASLNAACTSVTAGALGQVNAAAGTKRFLSALNVINGGGSTVTGFMLIDRLVHTSGISGTVTTPQTTNLPTTALTRYTTGAGVWMALEAFSTQVGSQVNMTVSYTNQAGTAGQISPICLVGDAATSPADAFRMIPFAAGDTGVRAVASLTLSASTTVAGNSGIVLFKPLMHIPVPQFQPDLYDQLTGLANQWSQILDDACLQFLVQSTAATTTGHSAEILFLDV